jgi:plastocyanin
MKRQVSVVLVLAALGVSCKSSPTTPTPIPAGPTTVLIANQTTGFAPPTLTVSTGTTVTWGNNDSINHTTSADAGQWDSGNVGQGQTFTHRFDSAGSFKYHCNIHPNMTGTIVVQ